MRSGHQPNVPGMSGFGMMCLGMACLYAPIIMDRATRAIKETQMLLTSEPRTTVRYGRIQNTLTITNTLNKLGLSCAKLRIGWG